MSPLKFTIAAGLAALAFAAPAQAVTVNEFVGHSANWLTAQGFDVGRVDASVESPDTDHTAFDDDGSPWGVALTGQTAAAFPGGVVFAEGKSKIRSLAARYGRRGKMNAREVRTARVVLHELLHQFGVRSGGWAAAALATPADWQTAATVRADQRHEEGAAEAVAYDLLPRFTAEMFGYRLRIDLPTEYPRERANIRQLSVFGSGAGKWTKPAAVAWRADFVRASYPERRAMVVKATAARVAWGQRAGR